MFKRLLFILLISISIFFLHLIFSPVVSYDRNGNVIERKLWYRDYWERRIEGGEWIKIRGNID
jgi:hypothetical protein